MPVVLVRTSSAEKDFEELLSVLLDSAIGMVARTPGFGRVARRSSFTKRA
jgi:hypothetical protein